MSRICSHVLSLPVFAAGLALLLGGLGSGCASWSKPYAASGAMAWFLLEADAERQAGGTIVLPISGVAVRFVPKPVLTEFDIVEVALAEVDLGLCLAFRLTGAAARDLYRMSVSQIGKRLILMVNGRALGARVLDGAIEGGVLFIFVEVPDEELPELVRDLNAYTSELQTYAAKAK